MSTPAESIAATTETTTEPEPLRIDAIRIYHGDSKSLRAFVTFTLFGQIKIIDATIKEVSERADPTDRKKETGRILRMFMPGVWQESRDKDGPRQFRSLVNLRASLVEWLEPLVLARYHEEAAADAAAGGGRGSADGWRS